MRVCSNEKAINKSRPMEDIDTTGNATDALTSDDEEIFYREVIKGEYELLFLDTFLRETLRKN